MKKIILAIMLSVLMIAPIFAQIGLNCDNPIPLTFPTGEISGHTEDYDYTYDPDMVTPENMHLWGFDVVYEFTLLETMFLNGTITTEDWNIGAFILQEEPNYDNPAPVIAARVAVENEQTLIFNNIRLAAGSYYLIISSDDYAESVPYVINLNATTEAVSPFPGANVWFDGERTIIENGMPMDLYYGYTVTQNIYKQAELNIENSAITEISYLYNNYSEWSETVEIYMKHTSKNTFVDENDWEIDGFTHVFSGTMMADEENPAVTMVLDTQFAYNNSDNLMVLFYATESGYQDYDAHFFNYQVSGNRSLTYHADSENFHIDYPEISDSGDLEEYLPVTGFKFEEMVSGPIFNISSEALTFEQQTIYTVSDPQTLTIKNLGQGTLNILDIIVSGADAEQFELTEELSDFVTLEFNESMLISVIYAPTSGNAHEAELQIMDDSRELHTVTLTGYCDDITIYSFPFFEGFEESNEFGSNTVFGWTQIGSSWEIINPVFGWGAPRTGDYCANMLLARSGWLVKPIQLAGGQTYDVELYARHDRSPDAANVGIYYGTEATVESMISITGQVDVDDSPYQLVSGIFTPDTDGLYFIGIKGDVAAVSMAMLVDDFTISEVSTDIPVTHLSTPELNFGRVNLNEFKSMPLSISNIGAGTLNITAIELDGDIDNEFSFSTEVGLPIALENGQSLEITVDFTPFAEGIKEATLQITDDLSRALNIVTLIGHVGPQGSACSNPLPLEFPAVGVTGDTADYGNDYSSEMVQTNGEYLNGDDVVYQFTFATDVMLNGTIEADGTWMGVFILQDEPNSTTPAHVTKFKGGSAAIKEYNDVEILAGTYYMIISTYPTPNSIAYTINLTATPINVELDVPANVVMTATGTDLMISWDSVTGATSYVVYGSDTLDGDYTPIGDPVSETSYAPQGADRVKFYKVKANN